MRRLKFFIWLALAGSGFFISENAYAEKWPTVEEQQAWIRQFLSPDPAAQEAAVRSFSTILTMPAEVVYPNSKWSVDQTAPPFIVRVISGANLRVPIYPTLDSFLNMASVNGNPKPSHLNALAALRMGFQSGSAEIIHALIPYLLNRQQWATPVVEILLQERIDDLNVVNALLASLSDIVGTHPKAAADRKNLLLVLMGFTSNSITGSMSYTLDSVLQKQTQNYSLSKITRDLFKLVIGETETARLDATVMLRRLLYIPEVRRTLFSEFGQMERLHFITGDHIHTPAERLLYSGFLFGSLPNLKEVYLRSTVPLSPEEANYWLSELRTHYVKEASTDLRIFEGAMAALTGDLNDVPKRQLTAIIEILKFPIQRYRSLRQNEIRAEMTHFRKAGTHAGSDMDFTTRVQAALEMFNPFRGVNLTTLGEAETDQLKLLENFKILLSVPENLRELTAPGALAVAFDRLVTIEHPTDQFAESFGAFIDEYTEPASRGPHSRWFSTVREFVSQGLDTYNSRGKVQPIPTERKPRISKKLRQMVGREINARLEQIAALRQRYDEQKIFRDMQKGAGPEQVRIAVESSDNIEDDNARVRVAVEPNTDGSSEAAENSEATRQCLGESLEGTLNRMARKGPH